MALAGEDLRALPLGLRKTNLARLLARRPDGIFAAPFEQGEIGPDPYRATCRMGLEGLVSKRRDRPYRGGRSPNWVKVKNRIHPAIDRVKHAFSGRTGTEALSVWQPGGGRNRIVVRELVAGLTEARVHPISHERYLSTGQRSLSVCFRRRNIGHRSALYPKQIGTHALHPRRSKRCQCDRPPRDAPRSANDYQGEINYLSGFQRRQSPPIAPVGSGRDFVQQRSPVSCLNLPGVCVG
jgi:hypothetical protein